MFLAVVKVEDGRVAKSLAFETKAEAEAHVEKFGGFVAETEHRAQDLAVAGKTVSHSPRPEPVGRVKARALKAVLEKMLEDEMAKESPLPEVAELRSRR